MLAPENLVATRVVASPGALDAWLRRLPAHRIVLRLTPDEALIVDDRGFADSASSPDSVVGANSNEHVDDDAVTEPDSGPIEDPSAIVEADSGYSVFRFTTRDFARLVERHVEFELPRTRPALAQGKVLGVPVKLWLSEPETWVICATAYAHELAERIR